MELFLWWNENDHHHATTIIKASIAHQSDDDVKARMINVLTKICKALDFVLCNPRFETIWPGERKEISDSLPWATIKEMEKCLTLAVDTWPLGAVSIWPKFLLSKHSFSLKQYTRKKYWWWSVDKYQQIFWFTQYLHIVCAVWRNDDIIIACPAKLHQLLLTVAWYHCATISVIMLGWYTGDTHWPYLGYMGTGRNLYHYGFIILYHYN